MDGMVGKESHAPDLTEPVAGYKVLQLPKDGGLCSPYYRQCKWDERKNKAECLYHETFAWHNWGVRTKPKNHEAPQLDCKCGLYAFHDLNECHKRYTPQQGLVVIVLVSGLGRIMVHQRGFRAEYQQVEAVAVDRARSLISGFTRAELDSRSALLHNLTDEWGVKFVEHRADLLDIAAEMRLFGVPESLIPDDPASP